MTISTLLVPAIQSQAPKNPAYPVSDFHAGDTVLVPLAALFNPSHSVYSGLVNPAEIPQPAPLKPLIPSAAEFSSALDVTQLYVPALVLDAPLAVPQTDVSNIYRQILEIKDLARFPLFLDDRPPHYGAQNIPYSKRLMTRIRLLSHPHYTILYPFDCLLPWSSIRLSGCMPTATDVNNTLRLLAVERNRRKEEGPAGDEGAGTSFRAESDSSVEARYLMAMAWATALVSQVSLRVTNELTSRSVWQHTPF